jgi:uncharacterized peroxidase-related enzyme
MAWIRTVTQAAATGRLRQLYDRVRGPDGKVDNILLAHGLRPHSLEGHMALYKNVLHHSANAIPKWFLEALGVYVSALNGCSYCVDHHAVGLSRLLGERDDAASIVAALRVAEVPEAFDERQKAALAYAGRLTRGPAEVTEADVEAMRTAGWDDGEILEINQVVAYFAYANRTVLGLGVDTRGDVLGLSPSGDDWSHL